MSRRHLNVPALVAVILLGAVLPAAAYELWTNPLTFRNAGSGFSSDEVALTVWNGTVYFADPGTHVIGRLGANGQPIVIAGQYGTSGIADGVGTAAQFSQPSGIALDSAGNMYVTERGSSRIRKVTPDGTVSAFSGRLGGFGYADGGPTVAIFGSPSAIAIDEAGMLYVADRSNNRIRKVTPAGDVTTLAGSNIAGRVDGSATTARFNGPTDVAYAAGYVYVADQSSRSIRKVSTSTGSVTTVAGTFIGSPADGSGATFGHVSGITVTPDGTLFVAEDLGTIRRIDPSGWVTTAGGGFFSTTVDREGTGYHARFLWPRRLCALANNDILLTDSGRVKHGTPRISDEAVIDTTVGSTTVPRQLSVSPLTATEFHWSTSGSPAGSVATFSSPDISNPTFTPDQPGNYELRLDASALNGSSITYVTLQASCSFPAPAVVLDTPDICRGGTDRATATAGLAQYVWSITNGTIESGSGSNSVVFRATTTNAVSLSLNSLDANGCWSYQTKSIPIRAVAAPAIAFSPTTYCAAGAGVTASTSPIYASYAWSIDRGTFTTPTNGPSATFTGPGGNSVVFVTLTVTDAGGCIATKTNQAVFSRNAVQPLLQFTPAQLCQNGTAGTATVTNPSSFTAYRWTITNGVFTTASDGASVSYRATTPNSVQLLLDATDTTGCINTSLNFVPIRTLSAPTVAASGSTTLCFGNSVTLTAPAGYSYLWSNGETTQSTAVSAAGNYTVTITDAGGCTATSAPTAVTVTYPPLPEITTAPSVCMVRPGTASAPAGYTSYQWTIDGGVADGPSNARNFNFIVGHVLSINLHLHTVDVNGCIGYNDVTLPAYDTEPPSVSLSAPSMCPNGTPEHASVDNADEYTSFLWTIQNGTIDGSTTSSNVSFRATGSNDVVLTVIGTGANGCSAQTDSYVTIRTLASPTILTSATSICPNGAPSMASVDHAYDYAAFHWSIANGTIDGPIDQSNISFRATGTDPATLTVQVTDFGGCTAEASQKIGIRTLEAPTILTSVTAICPNGTPELAAVDHQYDYAAFHWTIDGGTIDGPDDQFNVRFRAGNTSAVNLTVQVTDFGGCTAEQTVKIGIRTLAPPAIHVSPLSLCPNGTPAIASVDNPYDYAAFQWSVVNGVIEGANDQSIVRVRAIGSEAVTLTVQVTDFGGCTAEMTEKIDIRMADPVFIQSDTSSLCPNGTAANASVPNPEAWASFRWSVVNGIIEGANDQSIVHVRATGSEAVMLTVDVSDFGGCTAQATKRFNIRSIEPPSIIATPDAVCASGAGNAHLSDPTSYASIRWTIANGVIDGVGDGAAVSFHALGSAPVTLTANVADFGGCTGIGTITVPIAAPPASSITVGSLYNFRDGVAAGMVASDTSTYDYCGSIHVSLNAPAGSGYTYQWSTGSNLRSIVADLAGTYTVTVTNAYGCSSASSVTLVSHTMPAPPSISASGTALCPTGGSVTLTASDAEGWLWSTGETTRSIVVTTPGQYTVRATNPGCMSASSAPIDVVTATATITPSATTFCPGGSATLTASAGATYLWSTNETTRSIVVTTPGTYAVTITSADGCAITSAPVTLTMSSLTASMTPAVPTTSCSDSPVTLQASATGGSGSYSYQWFNAGGAIAGATASSYVAAPGSDRYHVVVSDTSGCSVTTAETQVTIDPSPVADLSTYTAGCVNDQLYAQARNVDLSRFTIDWSVTNATITTGTHSAILGYKPIAAGDVVVTLVVRSQSGCQSTATATVPVAAHPDATITADGPTAFCAGGSVTLSVPAGDASYQWSTGESTRSIVVTQAGNYSVTVRTNGSSCQTVSNPMHVDVFPRPEAVVSGTTAICAGGSATITATLTGIAPFAITWSDGVTTNTATRTVSPSSTTTYTITSISDSFCSGTSSGSTIVTVNAAPTAVVSGSATICAGGSTTIGATLTGTAPFSITWSDSVTVTTPTRTVSPSSTTTYTITSISDAHCSGTASGSAVVTVNPKPAAVVSGSTAICAGGSATISATLTGVAPFTITWSDGVTTSTPTRNVSPSSTTTYTITSITDANCSGTASGSAVVTVNAKPTAVVTGSTTICAGGSATIGATLTGVAPFTITWSDGVTTSTATRTVSPSSTTTYTITSITDANCSGTASGSAVVTVNAKPTAVVTGSTTICAGGSATIGATLTGAAPFTITWSDGVTTSTPTRTVSPSSTTTYTITSITDANCSGTASGSVVVTVNAKPTAVVSGNTAICAGGSATIRATLTGTAPYTITWSDGVTTSTATRTVSPSSTTTYTITNITDANCSGTASGSAVVTVNAKPTAVVSGSAAICAGGSVTIGATLTGTAPYTITWSDGFTQNGVSSATRTVSPSSTTTYTITSISDANCSGTASGSAVITVKAKPTAVVSGTTAICAGTSATISATLTGAAPFSITWSDGLTQNGINASSVTRSVTPANNTTYTITSLTDSNCSGTSTGSAAITVKPRPSASVSGNSSGCPSTARTITATLAGTAPFSITWSDGVTQSGIATTTATRSVSPATTTTYTITAVTDANCAGGTASGSAVVTVTPAPSITQQPVNITTTRNTTVTFHVVAAPAGVTYLWQTLSGSNWITATGTGVTSADFSTSQSKRGTFQYRVIVSDACNPVRSVTSNTVALTVN